MCLQLIAFIGCVNLTNIICNDKIKKLFEKILIIPNNEFPINTNDYFEYSNIETLEIPFGTDWSLFFHNFRFLRMIIFIPLFLNFINKNEINVVKISEGVKEIQKGSFKEMYNLEYIEIPSSMEIIYENEFSDCINLIMLNVNQNF